MLYYSDAADAALQAVSQRYTIARGSSSRGGHEGGDGQLATAQQELAGDEFNLGLLIRIID